MNSVAPSLEDQLKYFFSSPNRIDLKRIDQEDEDNGYGRFRRWLAPLRLPEPQATLLPCQRDAGGPVEWYAVAFNDREVRTLGEELTAFVGPSFSYFRGERAQLQATDPVEAAVLRLSGGRSFRVTAPPGRDSQKALWDALERMRQVRARRQERAPEVHEPVGRVLRDFFLALRAGNRDGAEKELRLLRDRYEFGTWNLIFLRVQMLSDLGHWRELLSLPELRNLLSIRRPLAVTEAILSAVYRVELEAFELKDDPKGATDHFQRAIYPNYGSLFAFRTGMRSPEVLKSFLLMAVSAKEPDLELRDEILQVARLPTSERRYLERLAALAPEPVSPPASEHALNRAHAAWTQGRFDDAFKLASASPRSYERAQILLQCAYEMPAIEVRNTAVAAVKNLASKERERLLDSRWARKFWTELSGPDPEETEASLPSGWIEWLDRLDLGWDGRAAVELARQGSDQWDVGSLLDAPGGVRRVEEGLMKGRSPDGETAIRDSLPHLLACAQRDPDWPRRGLLPLYNALLFLLATTDRGGRDDLNLFNDGLSAVLELGVTVEQYRDVVGWGTELWERFPAPKNVDWVLDLLDLLAAYPSPDREVRLRLLQAVASRFQQFSGQGQSIQSQQWLIFRHRCKELGHAELLQAFPKPAAGGDSNYEGVAGFAKLKDRSVALYTLTESVGQRVAAFLKEVCPSVSVEVNHDHVCTDRLRAAARNADIFVVATMSAKHAATDCIDANRAKSLPLLRPNGKGSASMLAALTEFLEGTSAAQANEDTR